METKYSFEEVISFTIAGLENIRVPIGLKQEIADPIVTAVQNLKAVLAAYNEAKAQQQPTESEVEVTDDGTGTDE